MFCAVRFSICGVIEGHSNFLHVVPSLTDLLPVWWNMSRFPTTFMFWVSFFHAPWLWLCLVGGGWDLHVVGGDMGGGSLFFPTIFMSWAPHLVRTCVLLPRSQSRGAVRPALGWDRQHGQRQGGTNNSKMYIILFFYYGKCGAHYMQKQQKKTYDTVICQWYISKDRYGQQCCQDGHNDDLRFMCARIIHAGPAIPTYSTLKGTRLG